MERHTFDTFSFIGAVAFAAAAILTLGADRWPDWAGFGVQWVGPIALILIGLVLLIPRHSAVEPQIMLGESEPALREAKEELPPEPDLT
ncbi:MAG: hypothetical protein OEO77_05730 [Acidimicrobiia bacterium]|nr:hypothetical protein [Acidimicrobiia bacterium]